MGIIIAQPLFQSNPLMRDMIEVSNLTRCYGRTIAVDNLSFQVARGEIVGFLGPNGAGKTTTLRILSGYLPATGGHVRVAGFDVLRDSLEVRRRIGYLPETVPLYTEMRVSEFLRYRGRLKGLRGNKLRERMDVVAAACGLDESRRQIIGRLSKGYRQRVGLADSLLHEPELLILDEPTIGLDPNQIRHIRELIKGLRQTHTILLSSHILSEVEMICQRVLIINKGRIVASDLTENLVGILKGNPQVIMEVQGALETILPVLQKVPGVRRLTGKTAGDWHHITCECEKGSDVRPDLFRAAASQRWPVRELRAERRHLEDVFVELTAEPPTV
jgi:ABC-2 type transport system ATP-binding protein